MASSEAPKSLANSCGHHGDTIFMVVFFLSSTEPTSKDTQGVKALNPMSLTLYSPD
jgi:hypothetical protein